VKASEVTLCIPTRGDVDLQPILATLPDFAQVIVYDNSNLPDLGIYARYAAGDMASTRVLATQDDDLVVTDWEAVLDEYEPGVLVCNYPEPWDIPWVARGAVYDCNLPALAFGRYMEHYTFDRYFTHFACDGIFGLLSKHVKMCDYGSTDLPHGFASGRVSTSPGWYDGHRPLIQQRCGWLKEAMH
jgi:hypothetical protein